MANKRNPLHTRFCEMFDIEYPIAAFTHSADTVYEVCNAGGLGILGMGMGLAGTGSARGKTLAQHLEESIKLITSKTSKPYGVDMLLPGSLPADIGKMTASDAKKSIPDEQKRFVQRLKEEAGIPDLKGTDPGDSIFDTMSGKAINDVLEVMFEYKVPVFAAALGTPPEMVEKMHNHGMKVISLIGRVKHASRVIAAGTDIIVAQGYDAGGHTGEIGTLSLVPQVVDAVRAQAPDMPVLAAGGIMDGRGLAAALALGADGIWTGTIWQLALEHDLKMPLKQKILSASQDETLRQKFLTGKTARVIKDRWVEAWLEPGAPPPLPMPFQMMLSMPLTFAAEKAEIWNYTPAISGQGAGLVKELRSCHDIMKNYVDGALEVMEKFQMGER